MNQTMRSSLAEYIYFRGVDYKNAAARGFFESECYYCLLRYKSSTCKTDHRMADIIALHYGFGGDGKCHTYAEIGEAFGVSGARIQQQVYRAFQILRDKKDRNIMNLNKYIKHVAY